MPRKLNSCDHLADLTLDMRAAGGFPRYELVEVAVGRGTAKRWVWQVSVLLNLETPPLVHLGETRQVAAQYLVDELLCEPIPDDFEPASLRVPSWRA